MATAATAAGTYSDFGDAALEAVGSDAASVQIYDEERGGLRLAAWRGFHPASAGFWALVVPESASTCGMALVTGERVVVPDLETEPALADSEDLHEYRRSRLRAVQSTPLVADGRVLGMLSTHWRRSYEPSAADLRRIDAVARRCAAAVADQRERSLHEPLLLASRQYAAGLVNRRIATAVATLDAASQDITGTRGSATFLCACGCDECQKNTITVPLEVYERVRVSPHRFLVMPGHATQVDDVVERGDGYEIVELKPEHRLPDRRR